MDNMVLKDKLGYFDNEKREYIIENMYPLRPLKNFLWNEKVVCSCDQFGYGDSFSGFSGYRRFMDTGERLIYVKDLETGEIYSPNKNFNKLPFDDFHCCVGIGYQKIVSMYNGLETTFRITVPTDDYTVQYGVTLKNNSNKPKRLCFYFGVQLFTDITGHDSSGFGDKDDEFGGLTFPHYGFESPTKYGDLYLASNNKYDSYAVVLRDVIGTYGTFSDPEFINADKLPCRGSTFEGSYFACMQYFVELDKNQEKDFNFALAIGRSKKEAAETAKKYATANSMEKSIFEQKELGEKAFGAFTANIPDQYIQTLINIWLKRQISLGKSWGRVYGKGFRDVMQDITAFVSFDTCMARERIIVALSHQYKNGNPIRMFDPNFTALYNDGATWIPDAVTTYIKESNDYTILDEIVPYLDDGQANVFEHVLQGLYYLTTDVGERGLVLFRRGDWNDSTNGVGNLGKGESVWTSLATVRALKQFAELLEKLNKKDLQADMLNRAHTLTENILKYGLYNGHFIHGYDDYGNMVGGGEDDVDASFCLNMQTWAILADVGDERLQNAVMDEVEKRLKCPFGYRLNTPPYTKPLDNVGRTSYFRPGLVENASVYIHGSMFKAVADCILGRGDKAYETICNVTYRNNPNSGMEPYAISNMLIGPDSNYRVGEAPMSWITGSAGWMYRALTEYILGIQADYNGLKIEPNIPKEWNGFSVKRVCRGVIYEIQFTRGGTFAITVNGKKCEGNCVPYGKKGERVLVEVCF